jgi:hypothetical protein
MQLVMERNSWQWILLDSKTKTKRCIAGRTQVNSLFLFQKVIVFDGKSPRFEPKERTNDGSPRSTPRGRDYTLVYSRLGRIEIRSNEQTGIPSTI